MNTDTILQEIRTITQNMITDIISLLPKIVISLAVLIIGWLVARLVQSLVRKFIQYLDKIINENLRARIIKVDLGSSSKFISRAFFWFIIIFSVGILTRILGIAILSTWLEGFVEYMPNILAAVIIVFIGIITGSLLNSLVSSIANSAGFSSGKLLGRLVRYIILFISIIIAIDQIGIDIGFLSNLVYIFVTVSLFAAALAFGLGAQTSVSNILGAYYTNKHFEVGNNIQIGEITGTIIDINTTSVILKTESGLVIIPARDFNKEKTMLIKKN